MFFISERVMGLSKTLWMSFVCSRLEKSSLNEVGHGGREERFGCTCKCNCLRCSLLEQPDNLKGHFVLPLGI